MISAGRSIPTPTRLTRLGVTATLGLLLLSQAWRTAAVEPVLSVPLSCGVERVER
jgi:hypothetical protein